MDEQEIESRFGFHKATIEGPEATSQKHHALRFEFKRFADYVNRTVVDSREKSLAFTALEEASMWAHKAIAKTAPLDDVTSKWPNVVFSPIGELITDNPENNGKEGQNNG